MNETNHDQPPGDPYQIVQQLLRRQDEVLVELDQLNNRIVSLIAGSTSSRQDDIENKRPQSDAA